MRGDGGVNWRIDAEIQSRGHRHRPNHADRIFLEPLGRVADAPDHASLEVLQATGEVNDRKVGDVVEERVHREVAAEGILFRRAERVVAMQHAIDVAQLVDDDPFARFFRRGQLRGRQLTTERGDLDRLGAEAHMRKPEAAADDPAVPEQLFHLVGMRAGADIEVLRPAAEEQVAHAAADQVRGVVTLVKAIQNFQRIRIDLFAGDRVPGARHDHRNGHRSAL